MTPYTVALLAITLTATLLLYYKIAPARKNLLLAASLFTIGCISPTSILPALLLSASTFFAASKLATSPSRNKTLYLTCQLLQVSALLLFNLHLVNTTGHTGNVSIKFFSTGNLLKIAGIGYYTLQNISYLQDVYKKRIQPAANLADFLLYQLFLPHFFSGPILTYTEFTANLAQVKQATLQKETLLLGAQRIVWGLTKKLALANRLSPMVAFCFENADAVTFTTPYGFTTWTGVCLFTLQLYIDFSAFMDICIGVSLLFGIRLKENFNYPLQADSIADFWRKWHISLMDWLKMYVFYPVSYRFRKNKTTAILAATITTFLISAAWHGLALTFFLWAACHCCYLIVESFTKKARHHLFSNLPPRLIHYGGILVTFSAVSFAHLFFRSTNTTVTQQVFHNIFLNPHFWPQNWTRDFFAIFQNGGTFRQLCMCATSFTLLIAFLLLEKRTAEALKKTPQPYVTITLIWLLLLFGVINAGNQFIYLQF